MISACYVCQPYQYLGNSFVVLQNEFRVGKYGPLWGVRNGSMAGKQRPKVVADIKRNRLYITLSCDPSKKVLEKIYTDIRFGVADLRPGFDVVTDLSRCTIGHLNGISALRKIMDYLVINKVGQVVRVIGKQSLLFKQIIRFTTIFQGYSPAYVATLEEAEDKLINSARRNGLRFHIHRQKLEYRVNQTEGKGYIKDISISGCSVQEATFPLTTGMKISLKISFHLDHDTPASFTIAAKVVRAQGELFAVQFVDLDDAQKEELYQCLAGEARRELSRK